MLCQALKSFTMSHDGVMTIHVALNAIVDVPANLVAGLEAEGYVVRADSVGIPARPPLETQAAGMAPETTVMPKLSPAPPKLSKSAAMKKA